MVKEVTRHVPQAVQYMLWGKAAGRCEFAGCNKPLWKSSVTQEQVNVAQKAHIYAFSAGGPRGNDGISDEELNDLDNLILACYDCHKLVDQDKDGVQYSVKLLQTMKAEHERRIELVTDIAPEKQSHVLLFGSNIGEHSSPLRYACTVPAMLPERYPADDKPIDLGMVNSSFQDRSQTFWPVESANLETKFNQRVRERLASGDLSHLSVFALAPQPLLILLGSMLTDIPAAEVYQLHREPQGWSWPSATTGPQLVLEEPESSSGPPALVFALSATVTDDRIESVLGEGVAIWKVTIPTPHNDFVKSREQLAEFRTMMRPLLDKIKACHGQNTALHIFPAMPVSMAVELGRVRMPKADMPWTVYDQVNDLGGFVEAITIPQGEKT